MSAKFISSFLYGSVVTLFVGPEKHRFDVHRGLLCQSSKFFEVALNSDFKEKDGEVFLPEQPEMTFKYFVYWLYTGQLDGFFRSKTMFPTRDELKSIVRKEQTALDSFPRGHHTPDALYQNLQAAELALGYIAYRDYPFDEAIALYILADVLQVKGLKDRVVTRLVGLYGGSVLREACRQFWGRGITKRPTWLPDPVKCVNLAWGNLPHDSGMCRLLLAMFSEKILNPTMQLSAEVINYDFLLAAYTNLSNLWNNGFHRTQWNEGDPICEFHIHDEPCIVPGTTYSDGGSGRAWTYQLTAL